MMKILYRHYMHFTELELREKLRMRKMHPKAEQQIFDIVVEQKARQRSTMRKKEQHERMWSELMEPLKYELKICRAMLRYDGDHAKASGYVTGDEHKTPLSHGDPRTLALLHYVHTLDNLLGKMTLQRRAREYTPYQIAEAAMRPNKGVHWSDWVAPSKKVEITALFNAVPKVKHVKRKVPFERIVPKVLWLKLHKRLLERTIKEVEYNKHKLNVATMSGDDEKIERAQVRIEHINQALVWIQEAEVGAALPVTWHGFY
jgi:hypothetical protein